MCAGGLRWEPGAPTSTPHTWAGGGGAGGGSWLDRWGEKFQAIRRHAGRAVVWVASSDNCGGEVMYSRTDVVVVSVVIFLKLYVFMVAVVVVVK